MAQKQYLDYITDTNFQGVDKGRFLFYHLKIMLLEQDRDDIFFQL